MPFSAVPTRSQRQRFLVFWDLENSRLEGWAYSQLGRWQEAISALKRLPPSAYNNPWLHVQLAVDYVELGRDDDARAEIAEARNLNPQFSLKMGLAAFPADEERAAANLSKAGLN